MVPWSVLLEISARWSQLAHLLFSGSHHFSAHCRQTWSSGQANVARGVRYAQFSRRQQLDYRNEIWERRTSTVLQGFTAFKFGWFLSKSCFRALSDPYCLAQRAWPREPGSHTTIHLQEAYSFIYYILYISSVTLRIAILLSCTLPWICSYTIHIYTIHIMESWKRYFSYSPR